MIQKNTMKVQSIISSIHYIYVIVNTLHPSILLRDVTGLRLHTTYPILLVPEYLRESVTILLLCAVSHFVIAFFSFLCQAVNDSRVRQSLPGCI